MKAFGFNWRVGEPWGVAHPDHICYADSDMVRLGHDGLRLGVRWKPQTFHGRNYVWAIGKVSSVETVKYGTLDVLFQLPLGRHLWPAIWLYDVEFWPPEIDVVEGWSGQGLWPLEGRSDYLRLPWAHYIRPGLVHPDGLGGSYGPVGGKGIWRWQIDPMGVNRCRMVWTPDMITVEYNGHIVMHETDRAILRPFNDSHGMTIVLNNYVARGFTYDDYADLQRQDFRIIDLKYKSYEDTDRG